MNSLSPTVVKAFNILKTLSVSEEGLRISQIARDLRLAKSTTHRIILTLEDLGVVKKDPLTKKYSLMGSAFIALGNATYSQAELKELARPIMESLMETLQETVFLSIRKGDRFVILDKVEAGHTLIITAEVGQMIPLVAGASGKVFLASIEEAQAIKIIEKEGLPRYTENTITNPEEYLEEVRRVRQQGYAIDYEEYIEGVRAVACSIKGARHLSPLIGIVGFKRSLTEEKIKKVITATVNAAKMIDLQLGIDYGDSSFSPSR